MLLSYETGAKYVRSSMRESERLGMDSLVASESLDRAAAALLAALCCLTRGAEHGSAARAQE